MRFGSIEMIDEFKHIAWLRTILPVPEQMIVPCVTVTFPINVTDASLSLYLACFSTCLPRILQTLLFFLIDNGVDRIISLGHKTQSRGLCIFVFVMHLSSQCYKSHSYFCCCCFRSLRTPLETHIISKQETTKSHKNMYSACKNRTKISARSPWIEPGGRRRRTAEEQ